MAWMTTFRKTDTILHRFMQYFVSENPVEVSSVSSRAPSPSRILFASFIFFIVMVLLSNVIFVVPAHARESKDRFRSEQWYLDKILAPKAWARETGSRDTIVAVLDAGFDLDHEDLVGQFWRNEDEIADDDKDNDSNGFEDDVLGWDFVDGDSDPSPETTSSTSDTVVSHGTVIAGIIGAATNNNIGIAGINWGVSIMPLRVLDSRGAGTTSDVREAIKYAVENGASVINLSFTFTTVDERLAQTIRWAYEQGVVVVAAIGNGNIDTDIIPVYPACFDSLIGKNAVIGVAATDKEDRKASFSNYGTKCVDLSAPGTDIFAAVYNDPDKLEYITSYASPWEGTSIAAPMVSAAAALLRSAYPLLTPDQIRNALKMSVDPSGENPADARKKIGVGRLNLDSALEMARKIAGEGGIVKNNIKIFSESIIFAKGAGGDSTVFRFDGQGRELTKFQAYPMGFTGGVNLATGDVDNDGKTEIIVGAGIGGGPQVRIFDLNGKLENQFFSFDEGDRNGIFVASGDVNGDSVDEILVTSAKNGNGQVRIFNRLGHLKGAYFPFGRTNNAVRVALGNIDEDVEEEIFSIVVGGKSVSAHEGNGKYLRGFSVLGDAQGAGSVTCADFDSDGKEEVMVGASAESKPSVGVYDSSGKEKAFFFAYQIGFRGGVEVAGADLDRNGTTEIYVFPRSSGGPQARVFNSSGSVIGGFFAFDRTSRTGGSISAR